jgi:hypothetical protein
MGRRREVQRAHLTLAASDKLREEGTPRPAGGQDALGKSCDRSADRFSWGNDRASGFLALLQIKRRVDSFGDCKAGSRISEDAVLACACRHDCDCLP